MANILILGAGIAGLAAGLECLQAGHEVTILEARDRLGGRIYTTTWNDGKTPIELGASFWEGLPNNPFFQHYLGPEHTLLLPVEKSVLFTLERPQQQCYSLAALVKFYRQAQQQIWQAFQRGSCINQTYSALIQSFSPQPVADQTQEYWLKKWMEYELKQYATSLDLPGFPAIQYLDDPQQHESWNISDAFFCMVKDGYHQVTEKIAAECRQAGVNLILNAPVVKVVDQKNQGVMIRTAWQTYRGDKLISTLPVGVLKTAQQLFEPPLSNEKQQAIQTLGVHDATRIVLEFADPFWQNLEGPYIYLDFPNQTGFIEFRNGWPLHGKAILQTDSYTQQAKILSDPALIDTVLLDLKKAYPRLPSPIHSMVYRWGADPFAQGAYPYRTTEITESLQQALERPEGNIYFAGADFCRNGFSVHNAYYSGKKVAHYL